MAERTMAEKKKAEKKPQGEKPAGEPAAAVLTNGAESNKRPTLLELYESETVPGLMDHFKYTNRFQVPRLQRMVVNMGRGAAVGNPKVIDTAVAELGAATGQRPIVTRAKKAIAAFK